MLSLTLCRRSASTLRPFLTQAQIAASRLASLEGVQEQREGLVPASGTAAPATRSSDFESALEAAARRRPGRLVEWNGFTLQGKVLDEESGRLYTIDNPRVFETVLPTGLTSIKGARVTFTLDDVPLADRVIIRKRGVRLTAKDYQLKPPVDFLDFRAPDAELLQERQRQREEEEEQKRKAKERLARSSGRNPLLRRTRSPDAPAAESAGEAEEEPKLYVKNIVVDLSSVSEDQLVRSQGYHPLLEEEVVKPPMHLKDMRSSRVLDRETNEYLRLRKAMGAEKAREVMRLRQEEEERMRERRVLDEAAEGVVLAWSAIHRSGIIVQGRREELDLTAPLTTDGSQESSAKICIVRSVQSFESALPTSKNLLHRSVRFERVTYGAHPGKQFAERIVVLDDAGFDASAASIEEARRERARERQRMRLTKHVGAYFPVDEILEEGEGEAKAAPQDTASTSAAPDAGKGQQKDEGESEVGPDVVQYGVITRWSGGQGALESSSGQVFYIQSGADFQQFVNQESRMIRGAVVSFRVDEHKARYAREIDILTVAAPTSPMNERPLLHKQRSSSSAAAAAAAGAEGETVINELTGESVVRGVDVEPEGATWVHGTLVSWSPAEGQGIVHGEDGVRYVVRDAEENVLRYEERKALLKNGRRVKFTAYGSNGRLACNVVALDTEADEAQLREEELRPKEPRLTLDGNPDEAIASPMSTDYWIGRMERSGFDMREMKERQKKAITMPDDDGDEDPLKDTEDLFKSDPWFNDPSKNRKLPGSNTTMGELAATSPIAMMNLALKVSNPKKRDKMLEKYSKRLTEEQKEFAFAQAKLMAPKYEEQIRKAKERNDEPSFHFY